MTQIEAIRARHSVRRYSPEAIPDESLAALREEIEKVNAEGHLHVQLVTDEPKAFSGPMSYGSFSGVRNYLVMAGKKADDLEERIGYYGERLVLLAQQLGLNSCWAGLSYRKIAGTYRLEKDEKVACYIALGYGQTHGVQHKSKDIREISNVSDLTPEWFGSGAEAALLAPTAMNQQKFRIEYIVRKGNSLPYVSIKPGRSIFGYTMMDMGIARLHFEIGTGKENFVWVEDMTHHEDKSAEKQTNNNNTMADNKRITPRYITSLKDGEVFVFGSNKEGMHGGGAARIAYEEFGAEWGVGIGMTGRCYAIPTMDGSIDIIRRHVDDFTAYANAHPELTFLVTPIGCGIAGWKAVQIAPLFAGASSLDNVTLPQEFWDVLNKK